MKTRKSGPVPGGGLMLRRVFARLGIAGRPPHFVAEFYPYAGLVQTIRLRRETVYVRFSDLLRKAPAPVLESAAALLMARLYRRHLSQDVTAAYNDYAAHHRTRQRVTHLRRKRAQRPMLAAEGLFFDLEPMFVELNSRYFGGELTAPRLGWSVRPWRRQLGCYDHALNQIVLSSRLDCEDVPRYAVEYVLYHEMLHIKHPIRRAQCGLQSHSPEFRAEEKLFADYPRAWRYLKRGR